MSQDIRGRRFSLTDGWPGDVVQAASLQDSGSQDFKAKATRIALRGFDQSVQRLCVSVGHAMVEIGKDGFVPVGNSCEQRLKSLFQFCGNARLPLLIAALGFRSCGYLPDVEKRLFQPIRAFQFREVLSPGFQDQPLAFIQIVVAMQKNVAVMHQSAPGGVGEFRSQGLAYRLKAFIRQFDHVKMVNDHLCLWQHKANGIEVRTPHIHTDQGDFRLLRQAVQVVGYSGFVAVPQKLDDLTLGDIANHTTRPVKQVNFIDPDTRAMSNGSLCCVLVGFLEDTPDGTFINAGIIGNAGKGSPERLLSNVEHQALCHHVVFVHGFQWLIESLVAGAATVAFSDNQKGGSLASDGNIQKELRFDLVPVQAQACAMSAAQRYRYLFGGDLIVVFVLIYRQNTIVRPVKNVQEMLSQLKILLDEFSEPLAFLVWKGQMFPTNILQIYSATRFAGFWM